MSGATAADRAVRPSRQAARKIVRAEAGVPDQGVSDLDNT